MNVPDENARAIAVEAAAFDDRMHKVEADLSVLKWMLAFNLVLSVTTLVKLFA